MNYNVYECINKENKEWIVLFHGIGGSTTVWYKQIKSLKNIFNVISIDLPSHGKSNDIKEKHGNFYNVKKCVEDIIEVLKELLVKYNIEKLHMMGVSLGTLLIHEILKTEHKYIKSAAFVGAVIDINIFIKFLIKILKVLNKFIRLKILYKLCANILMPFRHHKNSRKLFLNESKKVKESEFRKWFAMLDDVDKVYTEEIHNINIPKLYVSGSEDYVFLNHVIKNIRKDKYAKLVVMEHAGHVCNVDKSREFNNIIENFYKEVI